MRIKALVDSLISIGSDISEQEHVEIILEGLSNNYNAFSTAIRTRKDSYSMSKIEAFLLAQETRTDSLNKSANSMTTSPSVNVASVNTKDKTTYANKNHYNNNSGFRGVFQFTRGGRRGFHRGRGRGRHFQAGRSPIVCQVCLKHVHSATYCFHHFDHSVQPMNPQYQHKSTQNNMNFCSSMLALMAYSDCTPIWARKEHSTWLPTTTISL